MRDDDGALMKTALLCTVFQWGFLVMGMRPSSFFFGLITLWIIWAIGRGE